MKNNQTFPRKHNEKMNQLSSQFLKKPKYSKELSLKNGEKIHVADPRATRALLCLMDMQVALGGAASHWGGPSAFAEIVSCLMALVFNRSKNWYDHFHIINDVGHCENGLYALKANYNYAGLTIEDLKNFRSVSSFLTGHGESHLFPQGVYLSNGPLGSTLAQAQGLCLADRLQKKNRITISMISDGGLMEGEAKEALASIPGWAKKNIMNPFLLIISDNNTKLSGRIDEDSFSMSPTFSGLSSLGWKTIFLDSAHDLEKTLHFIEKILNTISKNQPIALQARTIKGYGIKQTEQSPSGGHGFPLKDPTNLLAFLHEIYQGDEIPKEFLKWSEELKNSKSHTPSSKNKVQEGISKALIKKYEQGFPIVSVSADLQGSTGVLPFRKKFPHKAFDVGVAEANMFSVAAGLSKQGFIPIVDTFAQFGVTKGALPLFMASLSASPVIAILSHIGFQDAADGASHQCLTYLAQTGSIPNTIVYTLSSKAEAQSLMEQAIDSFKKEKKNLIFFLGREKFPPSYLSSNYSYKLGKAQVIFSKLSQSKKACTIVATGTLLEEAWKAGQILAKKNWDIIIVHPSVINIPDLPTIKDCLTKTQGHLLTVEDHQIKGGMASFLVHSLSIHQIPYKLHCLGVKGGFGQSAYQAIDLYRLHGLDSESIVQAVQSQFT